MHTCLASFNLLCDALSFKMPLQIQTSPGPEVLKCVRTLEELPDRMDVRLSVEQTRQVHLYEPPLPLPTFSPREQNGSRTCVLTPTILRSVGVFVFVVFIVVLFSCRLCHFLCRTIHLENFYLTNESDWSK